MRPTATCRGRELILAALAFVPGVSGSDASLGVVFALVSAALALPGEIRRRRNLARRRRWSRLARNAPRRHPARHLARENHRESRRRRSAGFSISALALGFSKRRSLRAVALGALALGVFSSSSHFSSKARRLLSPLRTLLLAASGTALWSRSRPLDGGKLHRAGSAQRRSHRALARSRVGIVDSGIGESLGALAALGRAGARRLRHCRQEPGAARGVALARGGRISARFYRTTCSISGRSRRFPSRSTSLAPKTTTCPRRSAP